MPIQSRYTNEEFEMLMQDIFVCLEKKKASRDLSIMVLGNVLSNIFQNQVPSEQRKDMIEQFCNALTKSASK